MLACVLVGVRGQGVIKVPKVSVDAFSCKKQKLQLKLFLEIAIKSFHMTWQEIPKQGRSKAGVSHQGLRFPHLSPLASWASSLSIYLVTISSYFIGNHM